MQGYTERDIVHGETHTHSRSTHLWVNGTGSILAIHNVPQFGRIARRRWHGNRISSTLHRKVGGYRDCVLRCLSRRWHRVCRSNHLWVSGTGSIPVTFASPCAVSHMSKAQGSKTSRATYRAHDNAGGPLFWQTTRCYEIIRNVSIFHTAAFSRCNTGSHRLLAHRAVTIPSR